ncbi:aminotransferase class I/II-fold pyridoxal phosphate-dependent enzyme [Natronobacterium texcoconense]|uniref:Aspartate/methionine/tyrosine aminotransferase n=1 Tax=Natronobacterium texcoconense TaxID=1095778 RepID=A0A1H1FN01_NATTX|nr:aminotransferase class I/II-fold pyridoxal phosphate-dependent enzyme [Natronobacterium texcoconense]SDR02433.1 Aspartate/methionine/tyrosine aminotransferase [Natronobacterium texcoconense]
MQIEPFGLERWFAEYEHDADIMLAESGVRSLSADRFDTDPGKLGYVIPTDGGLDIRARIGERYDRTAEEVVCTTGTQEANFLAFLSVLGSDSPPGLESSSSSGDAHAVVVTPTYQSLHAVPDAFGEVTRVPLEPTNWELDPDAVADAIRPETRLIVLNNPNNPTGRYHPLETVETLYDLAADNDAYLLCDEVYRLLAEDPLPPVASMGPHGLSTASLSKAYGLAGLRFGWLAGDRAVVETACQWKDYTTISPGIFSQHVAQQALEESESILEENRDHVERNHEITQAFLERHGLEWYDPVGVNGFVTVPDGFENGKAFCRTVLEEASVVLAPGEFFGHPDRFRIGFGLPTDELEDGLARIERVLEG